MLRAFWTSDPFPCGDPSASARGRWFFDKSVWQRMFRAMSGCGFNAMVYAAADPFAYLLDLRAYPGAGAPDEPVFEMYRQMHHWVFDTALDYEISPYLLPLALRAPAPTPGADAPADYAIEYTHYCVRSVLEHYPALAGIFGDADERAAQPVEQLLQQGIADALDAARPDAALYLRDRGPSTGGAIRSVTRRGGRQIGYSVKYTRDQLVDADPDPSFAQWVEAAGADRVVAEIRAANFEPWTSFSFDTAEGIQANLQSMGCAGLSVLPLEPSEWPHTSDSHFKFQWQRDLVWHAVWGGSSIRRMTDKGSPRWLARNSRLLPGFEAASRILELLALYFAQGDRTVWTPQFCSVTTPEAAGAVLFSIEDMLHVGDADSDHRTCWWQDITGDAAVHPADYVAHGTPPDSYGPDELIEELADLSEQAAAAGEKGMRSASGEKELPSFARDAFCISRLGGFYVERLRAALAHARGEDTEALEHLRRALGLYKEIRAVDSSHRTSHAKDGGPGLRERWSDTIDALDREYADASAGHWKRGSRYPVGKAEEVR